MPFSLHVLQSKALPAHQDLPFEFCLIKPELIQPLVRRPSDTVLCCRCHVDGTWYPANGPQHSLICSCGHCGQPGSGSSHSRGARERSPCPKKIALNLFHEILKHIKITNPQSQHYKTILIQLSHSPRLHTQEESCFGAPTDESHSITIFLLLNWFLIVKMETTMISTDVWS